MDEPRNLVDFLFWWFAALLAATMVVVARLGIMLFGQAALPPADPALARHWALRRRWIAISEIAALPAFATVSIVAVGYYDLDPVMAVIIALGQGFVGFPLLLDGAAWLFRRRLGMDQASPVSGGADGNGGTGHGL